MPYTVIEDFRGGQDRRRHISASPPGTLYELTNGHVTRGGEVEKRKAFAEAFDLPAGLTFGAASLAGALYVFGSGATPSGMPTGVNYQQLAHPSGTAMADILDVEVFDGALYVIARYADNTVYHFYNGERVTFWDNPSVSEGISSNADIASYLASLIDADVSYSASAISNVITIAAAVPGVPFAAIANPTGSGTMTIVNTVENVNEVVSSGSFRITGGTESAGTNEVASVDVNGVDVLGTAVDWRTSNAATATAVAAQINTAVSSPNYTATSSGDTVTINTLPGAGLNTYSVVPTAGGNVTFGDIMNMAGGTAPVAQVTTITVGGTFSPADSFTVTLNTTLFGGTPFGSTALTFDTKVYSTAGSLIRFCTINKPLQWQPQSEAADNIGAGYINIANHFAGSENLTALALYQGKFAIFSRNVVQIWTMDADPTNNAKVQILQNTGTRSPQSVIAFSSSDVFYLGDNGVRSLKSKDSSNSAISDDVGTPIDSLIAEHVATLTEEQVIRARAIIEPNDGRYWLSIGEKIFVFSYFPSSKISAWSTYEPGFEVDQFVRMNGRIYARSGDTVYLYGGDDNATYDDSEISVTIPFLTRKRPATTAHFDGVDLGAVGNWEVFLLTDPNDITIMEKVGDIDGITYNQGNIGAVGEYTHYALKMTSSDEAAVRLINAAIHYEDGHDE